MAFFDLITGGGAANDWAAARAQYVQSRIGPPPLANGGMSYEFQASPAEAEAEANYRNAEAQLGQQWLASLPPDQRAAADAAFAERSGNIRTANKIGKIAALGTIGAAGIGAGLTAAGALGGAGGVPAAVDAGLASTDALMATGLPAGTGAAGTGTAAGGLGAAGAAGAAGGAMNWMDLIGPAASIGGALIGSSAAGNAADSQAAATNAAIQEQRRQFDLTRADYAPYRETGTNALRQLAGDINTPLTAAEVMAEPGYQFGLQQGQRGIDNKISAMGGRVSGQAIKAAGRFGNDYASGQYGAAYQRRADRLNRLAALAGIGQTSTSAMTAANQNSANNISQLTSSQGDATGAAQMAQGSIWGNALNSAGAQLSDYYRNKRTTPTSSSKTDPWAYWE
jgi:hypothetical protein